MDQHQNQQQEDFQDLENVESIDEGVLSTPAEEQKPTLPEIDEDQQIETFMQFNKTPQVQTDEGIILDLGGEKAEIEKEDLSGETDTNLLRKMTGEELQADEFVNPGAFLIIILVSAALFGFLVISFKRSEEINQLKDEINKLKGKNSPLL